MNNLRLGKMRHPVPGCSLKIIVKDEKLKK